MPELPEVETVRRQLAPRLFGRRVLDAGAFPSAKFTTATEAIGATFGDARRRGKYLLLPLIDPEAGGDERELVIHLGMTGVVRFRAGDHDDADPYLRAWWKLDGNETLEFADVRRFGRLRVVPTGDYSSIPTLSAAGPEPWDPELTAEVFADRLRRSRRAIKTSLLSQQPIAGVGNIYADEALWLAEINPKIRRIGVERAGRLLEAIRYVMAQAIGEGGTTLRDYRNVEGGEGANQHRLAAYGRAGQPCLRCGTPLRSAPIDARTTHWCPRCQNR